MRRYTQEERHKIIRDFRASGLTQRGFCRASGVNFHTLQHWLHHKPKRRKAEFIEVRPTAVATSSIRLRISADLELEIPELPPPTYLADLARTLQPPC